MYLSKRRERTFLCDTNQINTICKGLYQPDVPYLVSLTYKFSELFPYFHEHHDTRNHMVIHSFYD